jgi:peptide/nickel transport system ATP-binding protein/oligopeptide transport system ATP-binding protein
MYGGQVVELAPVSALFDRPRHPYTKALLDSLPARHAANERLRTIEGSPAVLWEAPSSCSFAPRCAFAFERCRRQNPPLIAVGDGHEAACWLAADTGGARATA